MLLSISFIIPLSAPEVNDFPPIFSGEYVFPLPPLSFGSGGATSTACPTETPSVYAFALAAFGFGVGGTALVFPAGGAGASYTFSRR